MQSLLPRRSLPVLAATLWTLALGCAEPETPETPGAETEAILGGKRATAFPEAVLIDMRRHGHWNQVCSGALITPNVVLTAGHCVYGYDGWSVTAPFADGQTATGEIATTYDYTDYSNWVPDDMHDVALVFLDEPITLSKYPTLAKQKVASGTGVVNVGRVRLGTPSDTKLYVSKTVDVWSGADEGFSFDYAAEERIEGGDSGGPVFVAGTHKIVAVNSAEVEGGAEVLARVDLLSTWIGKQLAGTGTTCTSGLTWEGDCDGEIVFWCEEGGIRSMACGSAGCGYDDDAGYYDCE